MATTTKRRLEPTSVRHFGTKLSSFELPDLTALQTVSYAAFLQEDEGPKGRKPHGLEGVLSEIFPISSYDGNTTLEYLHYELGKPRYLIYPAGIVASRNLVVIRLVQLGELKQSKSRGGGGVKLSHQIKKTQSGDGGGGGGDPTRLLF